MGHSKILKIPSMAILKDKASIAKATFSNKNVHVPIVSATSRGASKAPSDHIVEAVLVAGEKSHVAAYRCIQVLIDRLHGTSNAVVALKCLFLAHTIISKGSFVLLRHLSLVSPFDLSAFRDCTTFQTWEMSSWVRWYARVLEKTLKFSTVSGYQFSSRLPDTFSTQKLKLFYDEPQPERNGKIGQCNSFCALRVTKEDKYSNLLKELDTLVGYVEEICVTPISLNLQKIDLVYEVVRMVSEDYGIFQKEMLRRVEELGDNAEDMSLSELTRSIDAMKRLEDCRDGLTMLFWNRNRNDNMWSFVRKTKMELEVMVGNLEMEERRLVWKKDESTRFKRRVLELDQFIPLLT